MATPFDLCNLTDVKAWLDVSGSENDALLARLVTQISRAILTCLDRPSIASATYDERFDGGGERSVMLTHWPVNEVASCVVDGIDIPMAGVSAAASQGPLSYILDRKESAPPGRRQRLSLREGRFSIGVQNVAVVYTAGYQVAAETAVVPSVAPFVVVANAPYGDWANDGGVTCYGVALTRVDANPGVGQYTAGNGLYTFSAAQAGAAAALTYGYVPADLAVCCMDWVAERYAYRSRIGQSSKSLGGQETIAYIVKNVPEFVAYALQPYRRVAP